MPSELKEPEETPRDGTSQAGRALVALDPGYVAVDERTAEDLVAFAREYGKTLTYYGLDDEPVVAADGEPVGWSGFVGSLDEKVVAAFMKDPSKFDPASSPALFRPHFVLFLAFLRLLEKLKVELNDLTRRHLDLYFRRILRMAKKRPVADRVNLIFDLSPGKSEALVPHGSLVSAGPDSLGREQLYATDRDLVVNRAQVAKLRSLFVERRRIGLAKAREPYLKKDDLEGAILAMLRIALGDPRPGDPLPDDPLLELRDPTSDAFRELTEIGELKALDDLTQFTRKDAGFFLSLSELRDLMRLKALADELFEKNPNAKLEEPWKEPWNAIVGILERAGRRRGNDPSVKPLPAYSPQAFRTSADLVLGEAIVPALGEVNLETYGKAIEKLEKGFFFMSAESFHEVMRKLEPKSEQTWDRMDAILESAHREKVRGRRRDELVKVQGDSKEPELVDLIGHVLGETLSVEKDDQALSRLELYLSERDFSKLGEAVGAKDLKQIYGLLEVAQRNRLGEPPAEKEEWLNLYPAEDAVTAGARSALDGQKGPLPWATFGRPCPSVRSSPPRPALGWALSSPLLSLREGEREITLSLGFRPDRADAKRLEALLKPASADEQPLLFRLSTGEGWFECQPRVVDIEPRAGGPLFVHVTLELDASVPPITALPAKLAGVGGSSPVLAILLRPIWRESEKRFVTRYEELSGLILVAVRLKVAVTGLRAIKLQSDDATLDPKKPFHPFGGAPLVGSRFMIGHPEVVTKKLDSLAFNFQWMGAPKDLAAHYKAYALQDPPSFTVDVSMVDRAKEAPLADNAPLFAKKEGSSTVYDGSVPVGIKITDIGEDHLVNQFDPISEGSLGEDLSAYRRYLRWELNEPDFQHEVYAAVAAGKAIELASAIANATAKAAAAKTDTTGGAGGATGGAGDTTGGAGDTTGGAGDTTGGSTSASINPADYQVNPPYTPKLKYLTIDYGSSVEVNFGPSARADRPVGVFHIHPFGYCDIEVERSEAGLPFLPRHENDGELYIGLRDVVPPQTVSILFQLAEGSADPELEPQPVTWSYLDGDRWIPLAHRVVRDTTRGFINAGIIEIALDPAAPSARLGGGLYWLRAAVARDTSSLCDTIELPLTQAMSATFVSRDNAPDHYRGPLPPGAITKIVSEVRSIAGARQPYPSYGGRMAEAEGLWATRVSERLRHKQRALSVWDYERLVLDRFPEIYKAKCLPARPSEPGKVEIIVIPDTRKLLLSDPFQPKAPSKLLVDVEEYLRGRAPVFASVRARNARYVAVRVGLRVRFAGDGNEGYYTRRLNDDLNRFLSPWAYEEGADVAIGGKIYANSIVDFVDRRDYVDYVAGVRFFKRKDGEAWETVFPLSAKEGDEEGYFVKTDEPDEVLVADRDHEIYVLHDALDEERLFVGIGFMRVELDFYVA
jgi:hypothetical protein